MTIITDRKEIEQQVRDKFSRMTNRDWNKEDADKLFSDGMGVDSLYLLEMFSMVESSFGVMIPMERLQEMQSINKIVDIIVEYQQAK